MPLGAARFGLSGADLGKLELIETKTPSGVNSVTFTNLKESTYNVHFFTYTVTQSLASGDTMRLHFFESGVEETADIYQIAIQNGNSAGTFSESGNTGADSPFFTNAIGSSNDRDSGYIYFYNLGNSSKYSFCTYQAVADASDWTTSLEMRFGSGVMPQTSTVDRIKFFMNNGSNNMTATMSLYGIKE
jgi:hypothetical protein